MNSYVREKIICVFQRLGFAMESQIVMELKMNILITVVIILIYLSVLPYFDVHNQTFMFFTFIN